MVKLTSFTNGTTADADEVNANFVLTNCLKLGSGTLTLDNNNISYDVAGNYADIEIAAGDLTNDDMIVIELLGWNSDGAIGITSKINIIGTSSTGDLMQNIWAANNSFHFRETISMWSANDILRANMFGHQANESLIMDSRYFDTNTANVMTTAFTLRLNFHYASNGTSDSFVKWNAYVIRG